MSGDLFSLRVSDVLALAQRGLLCDAVPWTEVVDADGNSVWPNDDREVLVFRNGYVGLHDSAGRRGGAWGIALGWVDRGNGCWRVGGRPDACVTHWRELPPPPPKAAAEKAVGVQP